jgi:TPR repeat protein
MSIKTLIMTCGIALCLLAHPAVAGALEEGQAAYDSEDYATALKLLRPLAEKGNAKAQSRLGQMYALGKGVPRDYAEAVKWYRKAAEQGDIVSQSSLAYLYIRGIGVPQDFAAAMRWGLLAANQGDAGAQFDIGTTYALGDGIPQDYVQAHMWLNLAAAGSSASDTKTRDDAIRNRNIVAKKMTPEQIAKAQRLAQEWLAAHPKK